MDGVQVLKVTDLPREAGGHRDEGLTVGRDREAPARSEEHTSELQSQPNLVCRLMLGKKKTTSRNYSTSLASQLMTAAIAAMLRSRATSTARRSALASRMSSGHAFGRRARSRE